MEAKKQSSVEFLFLMLNNPNDNQEFNKRHLDKAKELHKLEVVNAWLDGLSKDELQKIAANKYYEANFNK